MAQRIVCDNDSLAEDKLTSKSAYEMMSCDCWNLTFLGFTDVSSIFRDFARSIQCRNLGMEFLNVCQNGNNMYYHNSFRDETKASIPRRMKLLFK